jgi:hypothetical protein
VPFLLAERARSECARSMRAVKGSLGHSLVERCKEFEDLVRHAQSDRSRVPYRETRMSELGGSID